MNIQDKLRLATSMAVALGKADLAEICTAAREHIADLEAELAKWQAEMAVLRSVVSALPTCWTLDPLWKTSDNDQLEQKRPVLPDMTVWVYYPEVRDYAVSVIKAEGWIELSRQLGFMVRASDELADSREAAEKLRTQTTKEKS